MKEDVLAPELLESPPSRIPTAPEIAEILAPWRPHKLRRIAAAHLLGSTPNHFYILRTHYGGGAADDAKLRRCIDEHEGPNFDQPEDEWFCVLDDAELFDVGDYWQEVYDLFPELAAPEPDRRFTQEDVETAREEARELAEENDEQLGDEHYEAAILRRAAVTMPPWLLVLDREAFETEELGLILKDLKGNPVKEIEVAPNALDAFYISWTRGMLRESYWQYARVGRPYRTRGKMMRKLLPLVRGDQPPAAGGGEAPVVTTLEIRERE